MSFKQDRKVRTHYTVHIRLWVGVFIQECMCTHSRSNGPSIEDMSYCVRK